MGYNTQPPPEVITLMTRLGASWRFSRRVGRVGLVDGEIVSQIIDRHSGKVIAEATGPTEPEALMNAARAADEATRPKPEIEAQNAAMEAELAQLRAQIAELEALPPPTESAAGASPRRGKPKQESR